MARNWCGSADVMARSGGAARPGPQREAPRRGKEQRALLRCLKRRRSRTDRPRLRANPLQLHDMPVGLRWPRRGVWGGRPTRGDHRFRGDRSPVRSFDHLLQPTSLCSASLGPSLGRTVVAAAECAPADCREFNAQSASDHRRSQVLTWIWCARLVWDEGSHERIRSRSEK
jgi:hypothetical protein